MNKILVLGSAFSGKTIYATQLYGRVSDAGINNRQEDFLSLNLRTAPDSITLIRSAFEDLQMGYLPGRTVSQYGVLTLPLQLGSTPFDILWPDYDGEQFDEILTKEYLNPDWLNRVEESDGLIIMIRLENNQIQADLGHKLPVTNANESIERATKESEAGIEYPLSADLQYVQLVQLLTAARKITRRQRYKWPLTLMLTCLDEVQLEIGNITPIQLLQSRLPLFAQYLRGAWHTDFLKIYGLSALGDLGVRLKKKPNTSQTSPVIQSSIENTTPINDQDADEASEAFATAGADSQGWVILEDGSRNANLTIPLSWLLTKALK